MSYIEVGSSLAASLGMAATGHCTTLTAFMLPQVDRAARSVMSCQHLQLEGSTGDDLRLSQEEGSWIGETA